MKYQAVLFDLDDTLLDSIAARVFTMEHVFSAAGITQQNPEQFLRDLQGTPLKAALVQLSRDLGIHLDLFQEYRRIYWTKGQGVLRLYPGVELALKEMYRHGLKLGIVTTKAVATEFEGIVIGASQELEELGVTDLFSVMVGYEDVSSHKPHPEGINLALSRMGIAPEETLMVGDSASDIGAAQAARCTSCFATWGIPVDERRAIPDVIRPDFIIDSPDELLGLVR